MDGEGDGEGDRKGVARYVKVGLSVVSFWLVRNERRERGREREKREKRERKETEEKKENRMRWGWVVGSWKG